MSDISSSGWRSGVVHTRSHGSCARAFRGERFAGTCSGLCLILILLAFGPLARALNAQGLTVMQQVYVRTGIACLVCLLMWPQLITSTLFTKSSARDWSIACVRGLCISTIAGAAYSYAVRNTALATVAFLGALPLSAIWGCFLFKDAFKLRDGLSVVVVCVGASLILDPSISVLNLTSVSGELAALLCGIAYTLGQSLRRMHSPAWDERTIGFSALLCGAIAAFVVSAVCDGVEPIKLSFFDLPLCLAAGVAVALGAPLAGYTFRTLNGSEAAALLALELPLTALLGVFLYSEIPRPQAVLGGTLVLVNALFVHVGARGGEHVKQ